MKEHYTPTTEQVKDLYHLGIVHVDQGFRDIDAEEALLMFDRWRDQEYEKAYEQGCRDALGIL